MEKYRSDATDKSRVSFYRCSLCRKEHVSSERLTVHRFAAESRMPDGNSPTLSHISPGC
jgi:hypothetical protein